MSTADNGKDALSLIIKHQPDIAILDISMPEMDGLEVIRRAKESGCATRFLILSGHDSFSYAQAAIRYGVKSYFLKPLNIKDFREEFGRQCQEILEKRYTGEGFSSQNLTSLVASSRILFLNQLIQSKIQGMEEINSKLSVLNLSLSNTNSCIVLFNLRSPSGEEAPALSDINDRYVCPSFESYAMESWVYSDNLIVAVFNLDNHKDLRFRSKLQSCINSVRSAAGYDIMAGIGDVVPYLNQCYHSYSQAQEALSYHIYDTGMDIYDSSLISDKKPSFLKEHIDYKPIIYFITHNDVSGITDYCNTFFDSLFFIKMPPPNFIIGMCMYLIMNIQKQMTLLQPDNKIEFEFTYEEISAFESVKVLKEWLIGFFVRYSEMLKDTAEDCNSIIRVSKEFIQNNLHRNIKAKDVAAKVNLSESYFTIYFKDKTGINFRDYILKAKINSAKNLLKSREASISEIAYMTGYQDYRSFSRAFKNETGMSPSEYVGSMDENP